MLLKGQGPVDHQPQEFGAGIELEGVTPHRNVRLPSGVPGARGEEGDHALLTEEHLLLLAPLFDLLDSQLDVSASFFFVVVAGPDGEDEISFPHIIVCPGKVQESHDGLSRFLLLEAVADVLDHPQELVFATSVFPEAGLRMVEDAPGLRQMVQTSVDHPFHGLHDARGEADGTVRLDRARWFPCLQQRNDGRIPPSLRHFRLVERLVKDPQQLPPR